MKLRNCRRSAEEWRVFVRHRGECGAWTNWVVSFLPRSLFEVICFTRANYLSMSHLRAQINHRIKVDTGGDDYYDYS